jgi:hypothetical protein
MAVEYTRATTVNVDEGVSSQDYNRLALAFNDRLKNGVADPTWRLLWYAHSIVRGMRNPNGFNYAAEDEWWKVYAHIKESAGITWPTAAAGEPEGINVANPLGAFIYGLAPDIDNEEDRINGTGQFDPSGTTLSIAPTGVPLFIDDAGTPRAPANITDYWELAKYQRGAVASDLSDYSASNAIKASQEHGKINYSNQHYFLKNYGGFLPSPNLDSTNPICGDGYTPNYNLKFTNLVGGSDKTYDTCQPTGVMFYFEGFTAYKIIKWNGTTESLPLTDYIEGPYEDNAYLRRYKGQQINQALNWFAMEYRANETEREESDFNRYTLGFQFQDFLTRQYSLAPAYGSVSSGVITAVYPTFELAGPQSANTYLTVTTSGTYSGGTYYTVPAKFTFAGYFAKTTGAGAGTVEVDVIDASSGSDVVIESFVLDTTGTTERLKYFSAAYNEAQIRFQLKENLPSGLGVNIECAMLLEYKPNIYDSYICLRLGSTDGPLTTTYDKSGYTFSNPKQISDNLLEYGCIIRSVAGIPTNTGEINENPVYESARRLIQNNLRMAERQSLVGYEVIGGKSYLHFKRFARGQYSGDLDVFDGMAPPDDNVASGDLIEGEQYQVWSTLGTGTLTYDGTTYNPVTSGGHSGGEQANTFFTATSVKTFTVSGDAVLKVRNGIRSAPIKNDRTDRFRGQTNEWLSNMSTAVYKLSDSSIYKPDAYADIMGFLTDRCGLLSCAWSRQGGCTGFAEQAEVNAHINYGSKMSLRPENPTGYRYVLGSHGPSSGTSQVNDMINTKNTAVAESGDIDHYKSCQIYRPDYEIEAVYIDPTTYYTDTDYNVIVKFSSRLDNENAPTSIGNSSNDWYNALTGLYVPTRRTDENAVLEYLYHIASYESGAISDYNCVQKIGDIAYDANSNSGYYGNDFHGNCYPRFYFSKQIRHVWNDENVQYNPADSLTTCDEMLYMEFVLQAISSGFIDKESTLQLACTGDNRLYDYTFPNLCYQALKLSKSELDYKDVTRATNTFTWDADPNALYSLVGVDGSGNETFIASGLTSPHTQTGVATYTTYRAYAGANNTGGRTIIPFTLTYTGANDDNVITFTEDTAANVIYYLMGRTHTSGNTNDWEYYTGSPSTPWSSNVSDAKNISSPETIDSADVKDEYRVESVVYGRKRWFEFLPATLRPDNAQGFGPMPNTNLYARIFNNVCNAVNLLVRARIELPTELETRHKGIQYWVEDTGVGFLTSSGSAATINAPFDNGCAEGPIRTASPLGGGPGSPASEGWDGIKGEASGAYSENTKPTNVSDGTDNPFTNYDPINGIMAEANVEIAVLTSDCSIGGYLQGAYVSSSNNLTIGSNRTDAQIRVKDDNVKYALPTTIRDQFINNPGVIGVMEHDVRWVKQDTGGTIPQCNSINITTNKYDEYIKTIYECILLDEEDELLIDVRTSPLYQVFTQSMQFYYQQKDVSGAVLFCGNSGYLTKTFKVYTDTTRYITIPLEDNDYPNNTY